MRCIVANASLCASKARNSGSTTKKKNKIQEQDAELQEWKTRFTTLKTIERVSRGGLACLVVSTLDFIRVQPLDQTTMRFDAIARVCGRYMTSRYRDCLVIVVQPFNDLA
jgi:hypothetical protein